MALPMEKAEYDAIFRFPLNMTPGIQRTVIYHLRKTLKTEIAQAHL